jgi:hypothetical protein
MRAEERIAALREAGSISDDEARELLEALADEPVAAVAGVSERPQTCTLRLAAAEVIVSVSEASEPHCQGEDLLMARTADGVSIEAKRVGLVEGWMGRSTKRPVRIELPRGWGLAVELKAGSVTCTDVASVRGRLLAGSWDVRGASFVDINSVGGDATVVCRPTQGAQRIDLTAGEADVLLLEGSDVSLDAAVDVGDIEANLGSAAQKALDIERRVVGARASGQIGAGVAQLRIRVKAGGLKLRHQGAAE